jgi:DNA-binding NarL/FixJ family response regulator
MDKNIRIIIADDHPLLRQGLVFTLSKRPNLKVVAEAEDGQKALELVRELKPDIAILDVQMPALDGFEVARSMIAESSKTKIIFLTMFKEEEFVRKVFDLGIKGFVLKENAVIDIVNCIESVMDNNFFISPQISNILLSKNNNTKGALNKDLTQAENRILKLIAEENTSKEIAEKLHVSIKTVENHRGNICKKLGITGNSALLKYALKNYSSE